MQGDVSDPSAPETIFKQLEERFGPVLVLVNNAGVRADGLSPQIADEDWDLVLATNLSGAFRTTRRALRNMLKARYGRVVNVASIVGPHANPGQSNYAASKAGLIGFTKTVAAEVARKGVTVNAVAPGFVETELTNGVNGDRFLETVPARRFGTPEEIAACVRFLSLRGRQLRDRNDTYRGRRPDRLNRTKGEPPTCLTQQHRRASRRRSSTRSRSSAPMSTR